jgi:NAD(P)-dependent dehydrogenase (short-subunit alcohol dehydrogenase family)
MTEKRKTLFITGSTDGVGRCVAARLARAGTTILIHGRDVMRAELLIEEIQQAGGNAIFYRADLASLADVRALADAVQRDHGQLDLLINNAGIGVGPPGERRQVSSDGLELRFAVNYLSGFLLTRRLLPLLKSSNSARIVNVASVGQQAIDFKDVMLEHRYSGARAYCQSKLAQIMFTFDLAEELAGSTVTANCLHPASYMDTTMVRVDGLTPMSSIDEGANAILHLADSAAMAGRTGLYFDGMKPVRANAAAYDRAARKRLRELSFDLVGELETL